ncbi:leucyl/phenylalanyl-tRNA--protein transferase [Pelistega sp. MC2]|uniref:leucyl/phenylalanyl-tRNA--protein transferase n=1 Tax=Pelistega sp. MC2 TaxID=1720297 RepID=UPI0008DAA7BE|nr:leucyl/phenylalanyl-tRNA--protein transferase [Pelistega sp. MC2]
MSNIFLPQLGPSIAFPDVESALTDPDGLLAWGGDLSFQRLLNAYAHGIFPWCNPDEPLLWWSPSLRMVLQFQHLNVSHSMHKLIKKIKRDPNSPWEIRIDTAFEKVMRSCAATPRHDQTGTWIAEDIIQAYSHLHQKGYAHSVETWYDKQLVGGLYGVSLGKMFFGESMFSHLSNASKLALIFLMNYLAKQDVFLIDCQQETAHLTSMGGACISRQLFSEHLRIHTPQEKIIWQIGKQSFDIIT